MAAWLTEVDEFARSTAGVELRKAHGKIALATLMAVATADAYAADTRTGREVTTSNETAAQRATELRGKTIAARTARRARAVLEDAGYALTIIGGRYLDDSERTEAQATHGQVQRRAASVRALTHPSKRRRISAGEKSGHLPRRGGFKTSSHLVKNSPTHARKHAKDAPRPGLKTKSGEGIPERAPAADRYSISTYQLASSLTRLPFLAQWRGVVTGATGDASRTRFVHGAEHIGALCRVIAASPVDPDRWTGQDVFAVLDRIASDVQLGVLDGTAVRNPLGYLATLLRRVAGYAERIGYQSSAERIQAVEALRVQRAQEQVQRAAERARVEALRADPAAREHRRMILDQMREAHQNSAVYSRSSTGLSSSVSEDLTNLNSGNATSFDTARESSLRTK